MTKKRNDKHSTEFGLWLRDQKEIDSSLGYTTTNIDYLWRNYNTGEWMLIEEKRYSTRPDWSQGVSFETIHSAIKSEKYKGFHLIVFEKTNPDDGVIWLDGVNISKEKLLDFLQFKV